MPYELLGYVPGVVTLPLVRPQPLYNISTSPPIGNQSYPPDPYISIPDPFGSSLHSSLCLVDVDVNIGPKFFPCLLQLLGRPPPEGPLLPFTHPLHLLYINIYPKYPLPPTSPYLFLIKILSLMPPHILVTYQPFLQ